MHISLLSLMAHHQLPLHCIHASLSPPPPSSATSSDSSIIIASCRLVVTMVTFSTITTITIIIIVSSSSGSKDVLCYFFSSSSSSSSSNLIYGADSQQSWRIHHHCCFILLPLAVAIHLRLAALHLRVLDILLLVVPHLCFRCYVLGFRLNPKPRNPPHIRHRCRCPSATTDTAMTTKYDDAMIRGLHDMTSARRSLLPFMKATHVKKDER